MEKETPNKVIILRDIMEPTINISMVDLEQPVAVEDINIRRTINDAKSQSDILKSPKRYILMFRRKSRYRMSQTR